MMLKVEGAGGEKPSELLRQPGGRCAVLCVSLSWEIVPSTVEVPQSDVDPALDLEHRDGPV